MESDEKNSYRSLFPISFLIGIAKQPPLHSPAHTARRHCEEPTLGGDAATSNNPAARKKRYTTTHIFSALRPLSRERKRAMAVKNAGRRRRQSKMLSQALQGACV